MSCYENKRQFQPFPQRFWTRDRAQEGVDVMIQPLHSKSGVQIRNERKIYPRRYVKESISYAYLDNVPRILAGVAKLAAGHAGTQTVIADTDGLVLEFISKVVLPFGHGADEDTDAFG